MAKKVNGKQKGNTFEREIANILSARFEEYTDTEKSFRRNPDSGSFFGGTNKNRMEVYDTDFAVYGDLICPRHFTFCIECKNYKAAPPLNSLLNQKITQWDTWLAQSDQDAQNDNKKSMLVIKYNRTSVFVLVKEQLEIFEVLRYKDRYCYTLKDVLCLENAIFFDESLLPQSPA